MKLVDLIREIHKRHHRMLDAFIDGVLIAVASCVLGLTAFFTSIWVERFL